MRFVVYLVTAISLHAQWTIQQSNTTAGLRGIHSLGKGVAWASGTGGTILRTTDEGRTWQHCTVPPGAEKSDFRGIQAFSASSAVAMATGTGDLSRLYRTNDACKTWKLVYTNPDPQGFWDEMQFVNAKLGILIGDAVAGDFPVFSSTDGGNSWRRSSIRAENGESLFAASNSSLLIDSKRQRFYFLSAGTKSGFNTAGLRTFALDRSLSASLPMAQGSTAGGFSLATNLEGSRLVAVGGDYKAPDETKGTAVYATVDGSGKIEWHLSEAFPHGYRSAVAYHARSKTWIAVGPNGTDVSRDDGGNWLPLLPAANESPDTDRDWNALSLPFVVGPKGRIGKLREEALKPR